MKKISLMVMPLVASSFLVNCGNGAVDSYTVNEQELRDAISFKGVDYLQVNYERNEIKTYCAFTPASFHSINEGEKYLEYFVIKNNDDYTEYSRDAEDKVFKKIPFVEGHFQTISDFANNFKPLIDKDYGDFYYSEKKKEYMTTDCVIEGGSKIYYNLQFFNKKITYFTINYVSGDPLSFDYYLAYDKIKPPVPDSDI